MAAALNDLMARIGYTDRSQDYLPSAAGVDSPTTLDEATTLLGFNKFIDGIDKRASSFKLASLVSQWLLTGA